MRRESSDGLKKECDRTDRETARLYVSQGNLVPPARRSNPRTTRTAAAAVLPRGCSAVATGCEAFRYDVEIDYYEVNSVARPTSPAKASVRRHIIELAA